MRSLAAGFAFLFIVGLAQAAQVDSEGGGDVIFGADLGERNRVRVTAPSFAEHLVVDKGASLTALGMCRSIDAHSARCEYDPSCQYPSCPERGTFYSLGDRRDRIRFGPGTGGRVNGGAGNDRIVSDERGLEVIAGTGDDVVLGGSETDTLDGQSGADVLDGRGGDADIAMYFARSRGVRVTLDGRANDGAPGEHDLVKTEWVYGGSGRDRLVGSDGGVVLNGFGGDDELVGGRARDVLDGNIGDDVLYGAGGDDAVLGDVGDDELHGGRGPDELQGSNGSDELWGGPGDDRIVSFDQNPGPPEPMPDRIRCGPGEDTVYMGTEDRAGHGCEVVYRGTPPR
jgi:hypothetical protein